MTQASTAGAFISSWLKQTPQYGFKDLIIFISVALEIEDVNGTFCVQLTLTTFLL
jgi:hypothetical protein